jgi:hypothetical protein
MSVDRRENIYRSELLRTVRRKGDKSSRIFIILARLKIGKT